MKIESLADLIITKVHSISVIGSERNSDGARSDRPSWALVFKFEGQTDYMVQNQKIISNIAHPVLIPKGCTYSWVTTIEGRYYILEFDACTSCETEKEKNGACADLIFQCALQVPEALLKPLRRIELVMNRQYEGTQMEAIRQLYEILHLLQSSGKQYVPSDKRSKIQPALDYIAENPDKDASNEELARLTGFSTPYFRKVFTEVTGQPPAHYIHTLRIEKAKAMLRSDYGSITDISLSLGYANIYDFSRTFKKITGISPSAYAKENR